MHPGKHVKSSRSHGMLHDAIRPHMRSSSTDTGGMPHSASTRHRALTFVFLLHICLSLPNGMANKHQQHTHTHLPRIHTQQFNNIHVQHYKYNQLCIHEYSFINFHVRVIYSVVTLYVDMYMQKRAYLHSHKASSNQSAGIISLSLSLCFSSFAQENNPYFVR